MTRYILSSIAYGVACGYNMTLSEEDYISLWASDDNWVGNYDSNMDCYWFFEVDAGKSVELEIVSFLDIEVSIMCVFDYLAVSSHFMTIKCFVLSTATVI